MKTILVVDDEVSIAATLALLLADAGHRAASARSAAEALAIAAREDFDVVLVDRMMPGGDGVALARALRADPRAGRALIVLMSGAPRPPRVDGEPFDRFLKKPFTVDELLLVLAEAPR